MNNNTQPCANKCSEFKGDQCHHCLIQQIEKREFELGVAPEDAYVNIGDDEHTENHISPNCNPNCNCSEMHSVCINLHRSRDIAYKEVERTEKHIQLAETELYRQQQEVERLKTENLAMQAEIDDLQKRLDAVKLDLSIFSDFIKRFDANTDTATIVGTLYGFVDELKQSLGGEA